MKHVKIMSQQETDKLIYAAGQIARQMGTMIVVDDENLALTKSYPILFGLESGDGYVETDTEVQFTPIVCKIGENITPQWFANFVKKGMHEEVPTSAYELYKQLRGNGCHLRLPVMAPSGKEISKFEIELEFFDFDDISRVISTDTYDFYFEAYFEKGDHNEAFAELSAQLTDYIEILDMEQLGCQIIFKTLDLPYDDVVERLNKLQIDSLYSDMYNPR